jgi:alcohol dehydrogenase
VAVARMRRAESGGPTAAGGIAVNETFQFQLHNRLMFGAGRSRELGAFLTERGFTRVLLVVDEGVARASSYYGEIHALLARVAELSVEEIRGSEEPDYDYLDEVAERVRLIPRAHVLIAIGGGSCLDMGKALAVLLTNPGKGIDYRGFDKVQAAGIPTLLIPTTAGTGSEVTINAVFTDKREMRKLGINGRHLSASWALLDAEWTLSCPRAAAVSAGMDAMVHTIESFMCHQHNQLTRVFSRAACGLLYRDLPCLLEEPNNVQRRQNLLMAAYLAGAALFNSGSGVAGAFSYPLGVKYKIPHGICGAVFLASVVEYNVEGGYADYAELLDVIEPGSALAPAVKARRFADALRKLCDRMDVPRNLDRWRVGLNDAEDIERALLPLQAAFDQNPIAFSAERDAPVLLRKHLA